MTVAYRFGRFELRPATRQLLVDEQPATLGARAFDLLRALVERRDRLVGKGQVTVKGFSTSFFGTSIDQFGIGEVEVDGTDVVLSPTTKEQCKDGGWRNFGFKNQGQCIKYVNHAG